jgi:hypothetical protein
VHAAAAGPSFSPFDPDAALEITQSTAAATISNDVRTTERTAFIPFDAPVVGHLSPLKASFVVFLSACGSRRVKLN